MRRSSQRRRAARDPRGDPNAGIGFPGVIGLLSFAVLFWGHSIVQLAGWEELLLVGAGTLLIGAEVFVISGFGVAGIAGIVASSRGSE